MIWILPLFIAVLLSLSSCYSLGYYAQSVTGQLELLLKRQPISEVVQSPETPNEVKSKLNSVLRVREFAMHDLKLPNNQSYLSYSDIERKFVVWNVFASPEFSLSPLQWCFPFAGCNGYVGFFSEERARDSASQLAGGGLDVYVGGVAAYSTLGWFSDPVLNTMLRWDEGQLASFVVHELAHQALYIPGDSKFNEAFATTVARLGVHRWLEHNHNTAALAEYQRQEDREHQFVELVLATRSRLEATYGKPQSEVMMRAEKRQILNDLSAAYLRLRDSWGGYRGYDSWVFAGVNNAKISSVTTYHYFERAFERLYNMAGKDFSQFYQFARYVGGLPQTQRASCLSALAGAKNERTSSCPATVVKVTETEPAIAQELPGFQASFLP